MLNKTLLVVSDKFNNFASNKEVITKSELFALLNSKNITFTRNMRTKLIPGQGFSEEDIQAIIKLSITSKNAIFFDFEMWRKIPQKASSELTHKVKKENILISDPKRSRNDLFITSIIIDDSCEMMRDHQTGLHLQGILLLEASRQAYLAIIEKFFPSENLEKRYFIFNKMTVNYNNFAFPIPAELKIKITKSNFYNLKKKTATMEMKVEQCSICSAEFSLEMTIMESKRIAIMEEKMAEKYLNNYVSNVSSLNSIGERANA